MIKPIQLLRESYEAYIKNFNKIFIISLPVLVAGYVMSFASYRSTMLIDSGAYGYPLILSIALFLICLFAIALFLAPAVNRVVQRYEDVGVFDGKEGYIFMKKNIWRWVMTNVWGLLYMAWRLLPYIICSGLIVTFGAINHGSITELQAIILASISGVIIIVGIVLNIHRFLLFKTIVFSKDISSRDAVRESITIGTNNMKDMWMLILTMLMTGLAVGVFSMIVGAICQAFGASKNTLDMFISPLITVCITSPMLLIMTAKTYVKVRSSALPKASEMEAHVA